VGDINTTLGTTLVFKAVAGKPCKDPQGLMYSHKLPGEVWLPGAASNVGAQWITDLFKDADPAVMDRGAMMLLPTDCLAYPLVGRGERFPFKSASAKAFCEPEVEGEERFAANLQGTAFVERLCYDLIDEVTGALGGDVYATGGGSRSDVWMQCRSDVTGRVMHRPACAEAALGSAILAAAGARGEDLWKVMGKMVRIEKTFRPDGRRSSQYDELFGRFLDLCRSRGWI